MATNYASAGASPVPRHGASASTGAASVTMTPIEHVQARSVTVSNLPREANEPWIKLLFEPVGRVVKVDFQEGDGPGCAAVTFSSVSEASRALQFDGYVAIGIALRVKPYSVAAVCKAAEMMRADFASFSRLNFEPLTAAVPTGPRSSTATVAPIPRFRANDTALTHRNLYVLNLPLDATSDQLTALFGTYGTVTHCVILAMLDAQARRRGFIDMKDPEEAKAAIEGLNGFVWHGYPIEVSYAIVQRSGGPFNQAEPGRNTVKRNVPRNRFNTGPRRVPEDSSASHGITVGAGGYLCGSSALGLFSRGDGMSSRSQASSPGLSDDTRADGYRTPSSNGSGRMGNAARLSIEGCAMFVSGLDPAAILDDEDLRQALEPYGVIISASLNRDPHGVSLGFGTVTFSKPEEASAACHGIQGKVINGRQIVAYIMQRSAVARSMHMPEAARSAPNLAAYGNPSFYPRVPPTTFNLPQPQQGYYFAPPTPGPAMPSPHFPVAQQPLSFTPQYGAAANFARRPEQAPFAPAGTQQQWAARGQMHANGQSNGFNAYHVGANITGLTRANSFPRMPFAGSNDSTPIASFNDATPMAALNGDSPVLSPAQKPDALARQLGAAFVPRATGANRAVGSGHASNRSGDSTGNSSGRGSVRSSFSGGQGMTSSNDAVECSSATEVGELHRRSFSSMRTPAMSNGPWGDMPGLSGGRSFPDEAMSPESTMSSLGSVGSNASQVNTPDAFGRTVPLLGPSDDIWSVAPGSLAINNTEWNTESRSSVFNGSGIQSLQQRSPPRALGGRSKPDPVGHERQSSSSSPQRNAPGYATHSVASLDLSRLNISA